MVVTLGGRGRRGRWIGGGNYSCNVYFFEIKGKIKIPLIFDQTIYGYTGVSYIFHTFFLHT